ncbi:monovalent cation/H+ antiporter complex subunit F [Dankookia sp. GCM10030260]|uniref:monovalent cation/H+ antiporter complex subunit F n=1 Tax=Dankookia sp. GCM10030260 TaxID=3273390 RepID=UPI003622D0E0
MAEFLLVAAGLVLLTAMVALARALRRRAAADRMMAAQLLCTAGVAALLLLAVATGTPSIVDVALVLALLAAFASIAFVLAARGLGER